MHTQEVRASDESVVDQVLASDTARSRLLQEEAELNLQIDGQEDTGEGDVDNPLSPLASLVSRLREVGDALESIGAYSR